MQHEFDSSSQHTLRTRREIKKVARGNYRRNFVSFFLACLLFTFVSGGTISFTDTITIDKAILDEIAKYTKGTPIAVVVRRTVDGIEAVKNATSLGESSHAGVISDVYRNSIKAGGLNNALLSRLNSAAFGDRLSRKALTTAGIIVTLVFSIFVAGIINVGICRLFLEMRLYPNTPLTRVLFVYRERRFLNVAFIVFLKYVRLFLWAFTIVGFPIKYYSYYLVPFIAAETPGISHEQVFRLSAAVMRGHKFRVFIFDLSFLGWLILSVFTLGMLNYLWLNPYMRAARTELYTELRSLAKSRDIEGAGLLDDTLLFEQPTGELQEGYADGVYPMPAPALLAGARGAEMRKWLAFGAKDRYSLVNLALMFFLFSFIGWCWECSLILIKYGVFVNRGTLYGPWIPIYGCGGVVVLMILNHLNRKPMTCFFAAMAICGAIEYAGATILWKAHHVKYWDYSGYFFNIQGRVCLEGLLAFGILCMVGMYFIAPLADSLMNRIPIRIREFTLTGLFAAFGADFVYSQGHPHVGPGITSTLK
jgi:uncharacterized membrane protein